MFYTPETDSFMGRNVTAMVKILFVCHGNICRSPMAEFVMKDLAAKAGAGERFVIDSAATSTEEIGNPVYPPARRELAAHGVACGAHAARQMTRADYDKYDLLIGMDSANIRNMTRLCGGDRRAKSIACWTALTAPATWPTPGTPGILRPPGGMFWTAARRFWKC